MARATHNHSRHPEAPIQDWTERMWADAEPKWVARDGQDSFYRDYVVVPGLMRAIRRFVARDVVELLDLGCGDGYCTENLVASMRTAGFAPSRVLLLDRSTVQLQLAVRRRNLNGAKVIHTDLSDSGWFSLVPKRVSQRLLISVFVVQELPVLQPLLLGLRALMSNADVALLVTTAPEYSALLLRRRAILEPVKNPTDTDWHWRGLYPIDGAAGRLYLPHFQRTVMDYKRVISALGLRCIAADYLSVPDNRKATSVFSETIYGRHIVGIRSSVLLAIQGTQPPQEALE